MSTFNGEISYIYEDDYYRIYMQAGKRYYVEVEGHDTLPETLIDPLVTIYRGTTFLAFDHDGGLGRNARLIYTPSISGYYSLKVEGEGDLNDLDWWAEHDPDDGEEVPIFPGWTGSYRLHVNIDDYRGTAEGTGAAGPVGNAHDPALGRIDYVGDRDVFSTQLISGLTYTFTQREASTGSRALADPELRILDRHDRELARNHDGNGDATATIIYRASVTGAHFLQAGASEAGSTGGYEVHVGAGRATSGNDVVNGTAFADAINGLQGADNLRGGGGWDQLFGAQHGDILRGQAGNDQLAGGRGADILIGGIGADTFLYGDALDSTGRAFDVIRAGDGAVAFELAGRAGGDRIDLSIIDANTLRPGNQAFTFNSTAAGGLSFADSRGDTLVLGNLDNDAAFELVIRIEDGGLSHRAYAAIDFLL